MRRLKYVLAAALVMSVLVVLFHDAAFRWMALRLTQQLSGLEVVFDGRFDITHAFPLTLDAEDIKLTFKCEIPECAQSRFGKLHLELSPWLLLRREVYIEQLTITDAEVNISVQPVKAATGIRIPFIEALILDRINVRLHPGPDTQPRELNISHLQAGADDNGNVKVNGLASLNDDGFEFTAALGSIEQFFHPTAPFPVDASVRNPSRDLEVQISGTLDEPQRGRGAELNVKAITSDVSPLRDLFLPHLPFGGAVNANARIHGDLQAAALTNLNLNIDDGERLRLTIDGQVANFQTRQGLNLQIEATSQAPAVTRYLTRDTLPAAQTFRFRAGVAGDGDDYHIEDLQAEISGLANLSVAVSGSLHLSGLQSRWPLKSADLDLHLSGGVTDFKSWLSELFPETGTVRAAMHINGSAESLVFDNVTIALDNTGPVGGTVHGKLAYTAAQIEAIRAPGNLLADQLLPATADLSLDLTTADLKSLSAFVGKQLPDLGPVAAKARLRRIGGIRKEIEVTRLDVSTTGKRPLSLIIGGQLAIAAGNSRQIFHDVALKLQAKGRNAKSVAHIFGPLPIDPGLWSLQARIENKADKIRVEELIFESGRAGTTRVMLNGNIPDLERLLTSAGKTPDGVVLQGHVTAASSKQLEALFGKPVPDLGRLNARFKARGHAHDWSIPSASITITDQAGFNLKATGTVTGLLHDTRFDTRVELQIPDPQRTAARIGVSLPPISAIIAAGRLEGDLQQSRFNGQLEVGSTPFDTQLAVELSGVRPYLVGIISTPVLQIGDFLVPGRLSNDPGDELAMSKAALAEEFVGIPGQLLSDQPLGLDLLHYADVDLKLIADKLEGELIRTERLELTLSVANGRLKAHHKKLKHRSGVVSTSVEIDNSAQPPKVLIRGRGNHLSLGALHAQVSNASRLLEGQFSYDINVTGSGYSTHEFFSTLDGNYGHVLENATLTGGNIDLLTFDAMQLLMAKVVSKNHTTIDCAISKFRVSNGVATAETLFLQTPRMIATGTGQLNFSNKTVDLRVNTEARKRLLKKKTALRIHGSMQNLAVEADLKSRAIDGAVGTTVMLAEPQLGFSMAGLSFLRGFITDGNNSPCIPID